MTKKRPFLSPERLEHMISQALLHPQQTKSSFWLFGAPGPANQNGVNRRLTSGLALAASLLLLALATITLMPDHVTNPKTPEATLTASVDTDIDDGFLDDLFAEEGEEG